MGKDLEVGSKINKLCELFTPYQFELMVNMLDQITSKTGYGTLSIVVMEGKIRFFVAGFSVRAEPGSDHSA
jgi:hypothetical protein